MNTPKVLKVVMLVSSYPRRAGDSASIFLRYLAEGLRDRGLEVHVLAPADDKAGITSEDGVIVRRFRYFPKPWQKLAYGSGILPNLKRNPLLWLQAPFLIVCMTISLFIFLHRVRPNILHAHWVIPQGFIAVLARRIYRIPTIVTAHGGDAFALQSTLLQRAKRFTLRHSDAWTTNTEATSSAFGKDPYLPVPRVIPMGVDVQRFRSGRPNRLRAGLPVDARIVLFVGRLVEKKGIDDLIEAYSLLPVDLQANSLLWVVGEGEQQEMLERLAAERGVAERITFWGRVPNIELPDYYAAADLFVAPSVVAESGDTEGQGVVFLEAFASKVCVLATRSGGIAEVITDGRTGVLVKARSPRQLATSMEKLLTNKELRTALAANAFEEVKEHYDWDKIAMDFENLYRHVCHCSHLVQQMTR